MSENDSKREVTGLVLFFCAIALILMYYLPASITGVVGAFFRNLGFGLLGDAAFVIPLYLVYAAIDFFVEKRPGVARVRVRSIILLMVFVAALLALFTMDFEYFRTLCYDADKDKIKATRALSLLWESGRDSSLIKPSGSDSIVLTGGIIGGGIAASLYAVCNRAVAILAVIVVLLSQIILVFHISLKKTARKTVKAIGSAVRRNQPGAHRPQRPQAGRPIQGQLGHTGLQGNRAAPVTPEGAVSRYVVPGGGINSSPSDMNMVPDPFDNRMPIDRRSGFVDMSDDAFGVGETSDDRISYGNRTVAADYQTDGDGASFDFTAMPRNPRLRPHSARCEDNIPSFLRTEQEQDWYSLDGATYPGSGDGRLDNYTPGNEHYAPAADDLDDGYEIPIEESYEEIPYNAGEASQEPRSVRRPHLDPGSITAGINGTAASAVSAESASAASYIAAVGTESESGTGRNISINAQAEDNGFSATEGRIIETAKPPEAPVIIESASMAGSRVYSNRHKTYRAPSAKLLASEQPSKNPNTDSELREKALKLEETLRSFGLETHVVNITHGPAITRFELTLAKGIMVKRITSLQDDIALAMATVSVRIEAPIPGRSAVGIEIPNGKTSAVQLRGLIETKDFRQSPPLAIPLGRDIPGKPIMCDLAKMPHLLIAGSTGSGKSVCINTILTSILFKSSPMDVRMILIDPKVVELSIYNGIPHLIMPVVTNPKKASNALKWAVTEMERRYKCFAESSVRDLSGYNAYLKEHGEQPLPLILLVIDELADLMTVAAKEVESQISRLAAMARAAGIHMIIATQRPSVDVITGVIKANIPSRIAFAVSSGVDSRTILDQYGAEKLLGKGDMLYAPISSPKPIRGQGAFLSDKEVESVVQYLKDNYGPWYDEDIIRIVENTGEGTGSAGNTGSDGSDEDELFEQAVNLVIEAGNASVSILQRRLGIGYPRAGKLIDLLEQKHIIGPFEGSKPRKVLITKTDWLELKAKGEK